MKKRRPVKNWLRYRVDTLYSRGTAATVITLGIFTLLLAVIGMVILVTARLAPADEPGYNLLEGFWVGLLSAIGNGSIGGRESSWGFRILMLGMAFGSIFIGSFFISALTNGMVSRVNDLKKGRSIVVEDDHTIILGWSEQIFSVIAELLIANISRSKFCIVILANKSKEDMEEELHTKIAINGRARIVCRTGDPMDAADLKIVSLNTARNIIVLQSAGEYPDADTIKTVLAITNHPERRKEPFQIVAAIRNPRNYDIAKISGKKEAAWLITSDIIARVIAQTSLQPGLSVVYDDLFTFSGQEIYIKDIPNPLEMTFGQVLQASETDTVIGVLTVDQRIILNPPFDKTIAPGERLIVIASDDEPIKFIQDGLHIIQEEMIVHGKVAPMKSKEILILGWNWKGSKILHELDHYVPRGSEVTVLADHEKVATMIDRDCQDFTKLKVCYFSGDSDDRQILEGILFKTFDHVIILGYSDKLSAHRADAKTLVTLLHLRDIKETEELNFTVVSEMLDIQNYHLATVARADDYVVSDRISSLLLVQVAEDPDVKDIFEELLNPDSDEIYLKPVELYIRCSSAVNFHTVIEAASQRSEVAIGYRIAAQASDPSQHFGVVINPRKSEEVVYSSQDKIIVLAENNSN